MRKLLLGLIVCLSLHSANATFLMKDSAAIVAENKATIKKQQELAVMKMVSEMSVKDYETISGKKMKLVDKLAFKALKSRFAKKMASSSDGEGMNIGGFFLGFFLGLIGALLSLISQDRNFRKWAFIGWGTSVILLLIILLV